MVKEANKDGLRFLDILTMSLTFKMQPKGKKKKINPLSAFFAVQWDVFACFSFVRLF